MDDYLTKPIECKTLLKFIGRIARRSKRGTPRGVRGTPPEDKGGDGGDAASCSSSPATDIPALEAHFRARVRKITRSLQQGAQRAQLSIVQIEADQLLGLSVLPELRAVRGAVQRVLSLSATDPAAACAAVAEVVAEVRAAFGTDKDKDEPSTLPAVNTAMAKSSSGNVLARAPHVTVPASLAPQNAERSSFAPTAASSAAAPPAAAPAAAPAADIDRPPAATRPETAALPVSFARA